MSKQVAALEKRLGVQLLQRTSRRLQVTEAGRRFHEFYTRVLSSLDEFESSNEVLQVEPSGRVRVALPPGLGRLYVNGLARFFEKYPKVQVDLIVSEKFVNLVEEGIDLAIRIGEQADSALTMRRIGSFQQLTVATPGYLKRNGTPKAPEDLKAHTCVMAIFESGTKSWRFKGAKEPLTIVPTGWIRTNDPEHMHEAVLANLGIAHCPGWLFSNEIANGKVVRVLTQFAPPPISINAVYPATHLPSKVRVLVEFFGQILRDNPYARLLKQR